MRESRLRAFVALVALACGGAAFAASLDNGGVPGADSSGRHALAAYTVNSGWVGGGWSAIPGAWSINPTTFTCTGPCTLTVQDAFICGDVFSVQDGATSLGTTPSPVGCTGGSAGSNPDAAGTSPSFSRRQFRLAAGAHSIAVTTTVGAAGFTSGSAYLRVDDGFGAADVPAVSKTGMLVLGVLIAGAGVLMARRLL